MTGTRSNLPVPPETLPTTPVLVGIGQHSERIGEPAYEALSPADLAARAASAALADAGLAADRVQVLACPRQFDETFPGMPSILGRPQSFPRAVASRVGADHARDDLLGQRRPVAAAAGHRAGRTHRAGRARRGHGRDERGDLDRPRPGVASRQAGPHRAERRRPGRPAAAARGDRRRAARSSTGSPTPHAVRVLRERAPAPARLDAQRERRRHGPLVRAVHRGRRRNPHAAVREVRTAEELVTVTESNRMVSDPYPKNVVAREKVNQAAAVLLVSTAVADELGIAAERRVHLRGHSDLRDREFLTRESLSRALPAETRDRGVAGDGRRRPRRRVVARPLQLLPVGGQPRGRGVRPRARGPAPPHRHRRPAVLRRAGQRLLPARGRRGRRALSARARLAGGSSAPTAG